MNRSSTARTSQQLPARSGATATRPIPPANSHAGIKSELAGKTAQIRLNAINTGGASGARRYRDLDLVNDSRPPTFLDEHRPGVVICQLAGDSTCERTDRPPVQIPRSGVPVQESSFLDGNGSVQVRPCILAFSSTNRRDLFILSTSIMAD